MSALTAAAMPNWSEEAPSEAVSLAVSVVLAQDQRTFLTLLVRQRDQDAGHGNAGKKRLGAVQRIQHPHELGVFAHRRVLLAGDTVIGVGALDKFSQPTLGLAVGLRDRAAVKLDFD